MKREFTKVLAVLLAMLFVQQMSFAQEIVPIPTEFEGSSKGVVNRFVLADTTSTGARKHPNCIYQLKRGGIYDIDYNLKISFSLTLVGEEGPKETRPAMLSRGTAANGAFISGLIKLSGYNTNLTIKNVVLNGVENDNVVKVSGGNFISVYGPKHRIEFDNCVFSGWGRNLMNTSSADSSVFIFTNNKFRNIVGLDDPWSGNLYSSSSAIAAQDTIKFVNNTFFNTAAYMFHSWEYIGYVEFVHNTLFVSTLNAIWTPYLTNAKFNNNIFYDYQTVGETSYETKAGHWDKGTNGNHPSSICKLDLIDPMVLAARGVTEGERKVEYKNNVYAWSSAVKDYWATHKDSATAIRGVVQELDIMPITFMNDYTDTLFFNNKSVYPYIVAENNIELDPQFDAKLVADVLADQLIYVAEYRRYGAKGWNNVHNRYYEPSGFFWDIDWPLAESLVYTNSTVLKHADGFPAGDLNWFPDEKAAWELVGVKKDVNGTTPSNYSLSQNYPNPFNPTTEISFSIPTSSKTTLAIYNVLGQKVTTLVNEELSAGSYKYQFDASNLTSGVYFYQLQSNDYSQVKKMMLLK